MLAAVLVTGILGFGVITGLNVAMISRAVEHLQAIDIALPKVPPERPPAKPKPRPRPKAQGAPAAPKASPIVAAEPEVQLPARQVIAVAAQAGTGASASNGQGGAGTGAGGTGSGAGPGSGGNTPARLVRNLSRSDYRQLTAGRLAQGAAGLAIRIDPSGRVDSCRVERSSGDPGIDSGLCPLISARLLFQPARNAAGQPIPYFTHYLATWRR
jgi:protein TonB